jgi:cobalt/nickel transport system permease protein
MHLFDELATKQTPIHRLHPLTKVIVTLVFLATVVSFGKYELSGLLVFAIYPVVVLSLAGIPAGILVKRMLLASPFVLCIGIFNPIFDRTPVMMLFHMPVSGGWVSLLSLSFKYALTIVSALLLLATTGMSQIAYALRLLRVPRLFVMQLLLTFRYISVLIDEAMRVWTAYALRAPLAKGLSPKVWGPLLGQMLLRTYDRALSIHHAMLLRGFSGDYPVGVLPYPSIYDLIYVMGWLLFFWIARVWNVSTHLGMLFLN